MNINDVKKLNYWELVEILNQWKMQGRSLHCKDCNNCTNNTKKRRKSVT